MPAKLSDLCSGVLVCGDLCGKQWFTLPATTEAKGCKNFQKSYPQSIQAKLHKKLFQPYALPSGITTIDLFSDETVAHLFEPDGHSPCFP